MQGVGAEGPGLRVRFAEVAAPVVLRVVVETHYYSTTARIVDSEGNLPAMTRVCRAAGFKLCRVAVRVGCVCQRCCSDPRVWLREYAGGGLEVYMPRTLMIYNELLTAHHTKSCQCAALCLVSQAMSGEQSTRVCGSRAITDSRYEEVIRLGNFQMSEASNNPILPVRP